MKEILLTKNQVALVDDEDFESLNQFKWYAVKDKNSYYARRSTKIDGKHIKIRMHRQIMNTPPDMDTDHIDHNGLNNQKSNLRICTTSQNLMNRKRDITRHSSDYKGVYWAELCKKWRARIHLNGKTTHIGVFTTQEEAALAYNKKAKELFGEFAYLNVVNI